MTCDYSESGCEEHCPVSVWQYGSIAHVTKAFITIDQAVINTLRMYGLHDKHPPKYATLGALPLLSPSTAADIGNSMMQQQQAELRQYHTETVVNIL